MKLEMRRPLAAIGLLVACATTGAAQIGGAVGSGGAGVGGGAGPGGAMPSQPTPPADAQRGGTAADHLIVKYHVEGGFLGNVSTDLTVLEDGRVKLAEKANGSEISWEGRLEREEVAGLDAAVTRAFRHLNLRGPRRGSDEPRRTFTARFGDSTIERSANLDDLETAYLIRWLDTLDPMVRAGELDDEQKLVEVKLVREDQGGLSAQVVLVTRQRQEIDYAIDAIGMRREVGRHTLDPVELRSVKMLLVIAAPAANPLVKPHETPAEAAYVLRFWDNADPTMRRDIHPFAETVIGMPATEILQYVLSL